MDNFALIAEQRRRVADTLAGLTDDQWSEPSLCGDWTVQHVAGHLSSGWNISTPRFIRGLVRARGSFNNANARFGRELGARSTEEIIADLRANAEHTFTPPGAGSEAPLADVLVHAQDMFIP
ncbi:MAG: maleylpyruvate isomerase family mycothiol-dependent enzyme, partial [Acidimicrobiia bacterium]|nr:maleylpyruvate isomerase family mycothiol-dependent enzyme [Acidimicrobiia bacterium]